MGNKEGIGGVVLICDDRVDGGCQPQAMSGASSTNSTLH